MNKRTDRAVDTVRFFAVVTGIALTCGSHFGSEREKQALRDDVARESNARRELRGQFDSYKERAKPRHLDRFAGRRIVSTLRQLGCPTQLTIGHDSTDHEARAYAEAIGAAFAAAGCRVHINNMVGGLRADLTGLHVAIAPGRTTAPKEAERLVFVLAAAGVELSHEAGSLPGLSGDDFSLIVGGKPTL